MEPENSACDPSVMQFFEDMQKALNDNNAADISEQFDVWDEQANLHPIHNESINLSPQRENYVIEPEEFRDDHQEYSLFEKNSTGFNKSSDNGFRDESKIDHEEYKESTPGTGKTGKTVKRHTKCESKCENEDDAKTNSKSVLTNKERARIARKRKKQYYEDLETKNKYLEEKVKQLTKEVNYYKDLAQRENRSGSVSSFENQPQSTISCLQHECLNMIRCLPDENHVFQVKNKFSEACRPFSTRKIKHLDKAFETILDNMF